jgi:hypothetical protein
MPKHLRQKFGFLDQGLCEKTDKTADEYQRFSNALILSNSDTIIRPAGRRFRDIQKHRMLGTLAVMAVSTVETRLLPAAVAIFQNQIGGDSRGTAVRPECPALSHIAA